MNFDAYVNNQVFRKDWPVILALNAHLATILPIRLAAGDSQFNSNGAIAGQVLAPDNLSPPLFHRYSAVSGTYNANCILLDSLDVSQFTATAASGNTVAARGVFGGEVYLNNLIDASTTALNSSNLGGKTITDANNVPIYKF